jgi:hypothetical protein
MVLFIVNGEDVPVQADPDLPLALAKRRALTLSRNTGRPDQDWELRHETGVLVDEEAASSTVDGRRLFLTLRVGAGGWRSASTIHDLRPTVFDRPDHCVVMPPAFESLLRLTLSEALRSGIAPRVTILHGRDADYYSDK